LGLKWPDPIANGVVDFPVSSVIWLPVLSVDLAARIVIFYLLRYDENMFVTPCIWISCTQESRTLPESTHQWTVVIGSRSDSLDQARFFRF
jgi:hypothetical protein